jgi:hypothetical protein
MNRKAHESMKAFSTGVTGSRQQVATSTPRQNTTVSKGFFDESGRRMDERRDRRRRGDLVGDRRTGRRPSGRRDHQAVQYQVLNSQSAQNAESQIATPMPRGCAIRSRGYSRKEVVEESMMTRTNVSQGSVDGLLPALRTAQNAIHLPEVQAMLQKLSEYKLGIFMPHMHDGQTGEFQLLPEDMMQVESGVEVSFRSTADIVKQSDRFLPVGWLWRAGASMPVAACEMVWDDGQDSAARPVKHTMSKGD